MRLTSVRKGTSMISRVHAIGCVLVVGFLALAPSDSFGRSAGGGLSPFASRAHPTLRAPHNAWWSWRHRAGIVAVAPYGYDPSGYAVPYYQPSFPDPESLAGSFARSVAPAEAPRSRCHSSVVKVPSEDGGERAINTVRC